MKTPNEGELAEIAKRFGAVGIFVIISDSQLPCPDTRAGEQCHHAHQVLVGGLGIAPAVAADIAAVQLEKMRLKAEHPDLPEEEINDMLLNGE